MSFRFHLIMVIKFYLVFGSKRICTFFKFFKIHIHLADILYHKKYTLSRFIWWTWMDSNHRPHAYQACALTSWATGPYIINSVRIFRFFLIFHNPWNMEDFGFLLRKEVIQPHLPIRLPCYDFTPVIDPTFDCCFPKVCSQASGITSFHGVTGGVYKTRERIHRSILICDY